MLSPNYTYKATITKVVDGDTVDAVIDVGFKISTTQRLRINRIDTYEMNSDDPTERDLAAKGKEYLVANILNKPVVVTTTKADSFGRYLTEILFEKDGVQLNAGDELLRLELAVLYVK